MGVPAFYRWLSEKYPKIQQDVLEERVKMLGGDGSTRMPFDCTRPNPSGLECDNLYIDMNGIIHPCSHPEQGPQPTTEEEMYENVCLYVDRLFRIMRPRKLLYLAIDGVAPRAKMNQQRSRRFRSAQEARENLEVEENVRQELTKMGQRVPAAKKAWDSNVITPGTPFMLRLSEYIRFYVRKRISTDKAWKNIRVIYSDASVPGEGEHKIMAHVRLQRSQPGYDPNIVHVLHGLDADLIMLALATHEAHFYISREEVLFGRKSQETNDRRQLESGHQDKQRQFDEEAGGTAMQLLENRQKPLCRISIPILREYLEADFAACLTPGRLTFAPSLERLIDDIVFLCFFVGNDFLPHLPSLDIRDGGLDYLFNVYKRILPTFGDYITNHGGQVNLSHVDVILAEVGAIEDYVFAMKHDNEQRDKQRREQFNKRKKQSQGRSLEDPKTALEQPAPKAMGRAGKILEKQAERSLKKEGDVKIKVSHKPTTDNLEAALALKKSLLGGTIKAEDDDKAPVKMDEDDAPVKEDPVEEEGDSAAVKEEEETTVGADPSSGQKRKLEDVETDDAVVKEEDGAIKKESSGVGVVGDAEEEFEDDAEDDDEDEPKTPIPVEIDPAVASAFKDKVKSVQQKQLDDYAKNVEDKVRLHESGWKDRYYTDKCKADDVENNGGREHLFRSYVMGLCWVMKYYYEGCPDWKWFYPFHYAPFASDLRNIERFQTDVKSFELNTPFNPVEQLMAVLPSDSAHAVPTAARWEMMDPESPIIDFYPKDVPVDPNGKAMPWLWVVLLPFIDEERLLAALTPTMAKWTKTELLGNARGLDDGYLYIHSSHPLTQKLSSVLASGKTAKSPKTRLTDSASYGCAGFTGAVRPPLSNELYTVEEDVTIQPPPVSEKAQLSSSDNIFTEAIISNASVCVAFTEPPKLSHKSILLPGAKSPVTSLTDADRRITRPKLNRGGGTIAYMGATSNGQSSKSGFGSMNINSYERNLAQSTGRGNQMNQAGTRAWGAMEPTPKRQYQPSNPFHGRQNGGPPPPPPQNRPPWQQNQGHRQGGPPGRHQQQQQQQQWQNQGQQQHGYNQGHHQQRQQGYPQQQMHQQQGPPARQQAQRGRGPPPQRQGFDFRAMNRQPGPPAQPNRPQPNRPPPPPPPSQRANASVMNSLKAQLASTLNKNRKNDKG